ncbi:S1C family serine protease [Gehongia tenuis]|uniref:Trypsin-like peptidase domain-containing protein n=1 Tax=Gehongia tenuis TaxID=2763655 RepID=A0A926HNG5_9FIRM|nr:trypsin-like peptidase domain-containing protein [Gehongia tenuis]MBC8530584.1 trypsin-like peptidase domain-containing protein [Gehongia tenuis]
MMNHNYYDEAVSHVVDEALGAGPAFEHSNGASGQPGYTPAGSGAPEGQGAAHRNHPPKKRPFKVLRFTAIAAAIAVTATGSSFLTAHLMEERMAEIAASQVQSGGAASGLTRTALGGTASTQEIVSEVSPSIVGIKMTVSVPSRNPYAYYYGGGGGTQQTSGEGSGIIVSQDGTILTNYHVVEYADPEGQYGEYTQLTVTLSDGTEYPATFVKGDSERDLALIKIEAANLPAATLGDSDDLSVGETVLCFGSPLGLQGSVSQGVVSAVNRELAAGETGGTQSFVQTDAAINSGNSGGALVNSRGEVVGVNSAKISASGVEGLGFAIPINDAKAFIAGTAEGTTI